MKIALITGGSRGLGKGMACHLAEAGVDVILTYNTRQDEAERVVADLAARGRKAVALQLDVTRPETFDGFAGAVRGALEAGWGRPAFDFLVNSAGMGVYASVRDTTPEQV